MQDFRRERSAPLRSDEAEGALPSSSTSGFVRLQKALARGIISADSFGNAARSDDGLRRTIPYILSLGLIALITLFGLQIEHRIAPTNVAMLYLLAVVVSALRWGRGPALLSAIVGAVAFDFFMIPPYQSFAITDFWYVITLLSLLVVGLLISALASEAREQAKTARQHQMSTEAMYAFSESLASSTDLDQIVAAAGKKIVETFQWPALIAIHVESGLSVRFRSPEFPDNADEQEAMESAFQRNEAAGRGTSHVPQAGGYYLPLRTAWGVKGILAVLMTGSSARLNARRHPLLEVFASRAALAIGRAILEETARQAELLQQTDKMQKALLNSISHNLRTPLAAVTGALQSLLQDSAVLDEPTRLELLTNAQEQAVRLNRLVGNLLDMTRLEAGAVHVKLEPCDLLDVIGAALEQLGETAQKRSVLLDVPPHQILAPLDSVLISQVLVNLVDNALKYSPASEPVEIRVREGVEDLEIAVLDRGIGIADQDLSLVFERFHRGRRTAQAAGTGLGLSICRGFVEAHGGRIWAERRMPTGTIIAFTIPISARRDPIEEAEDHEHTGTASPRH